MQRKTSRLIALTLAVATLLMGMALPAGAHGSRGWRGPRPGHYFAIPFPPIPIPIPRIVIHHQRDYYGGGDRDYGYDDYAPPPRYYDRGRYYDDSDSDSDHRHHRGCHHH